MLEKWKIHFDRQAYMTKDLDSDRAIETVDDDEFCFAEIAERLGPSIVKASKGDGMVIGIEGRWGSGKTSLLNFLRTELAKAKGENIHTISVAPWLNGDKESLVASVLEPMANILERIESENATPGEQAGAKVVENAKILRELVSSYGGKTARRLAPIADLAGYVVPGAQAAGGILGAAANVLEGAAERQPTPTEMKAKIVDLVRALDVGFVVILDDLDRLEPAQAVEVVRLVRSVADFPKVAYLMCYDRDVLADALSEGLKVKDGDLFLQKIVQLTFSIPLPEPFDLRAQFLNEALELYKEVHGEELSGADLDDLRIGVDREGQGLTTPREVKLALNGIRFTYPTVCKYVYFPDFCRLHLIKTTQFKLYKWLENYLSVRSIIASGDGMVDADEKKRCGKELKKLFPSKKPDSSRSIWHASTFIPGIEGMRSAKETVFAHSPNHAYESFARQKRLGSPQHYRYYFALTGPKTFMSDEDFEKIVRLAGEDATELSVSLKENSRKLRQSGKTWFEHILDRLNERVLDGLDEEHLVGMVIAICETMDAVLEIDKGPQFGVPSVPRYACNVVGQCMRRLENLSVERHHSLAQWIAAECSSINWLVGDLMRYELFRHGRAGGGKQKTTPEEWFFSDDMLNKLLNIIGMRISEGLLQNQILSMPDVSGFMYGWRDISGVNLPREWIAEITKEDESFLKFLNEMRGYAVSDHVYHPLHRSTLELFFPDADSVVQRVLGLLEGEHEVKARDVLGAIEKGERY